MRRATRGACRARPQSRPHFYPRSPCGERLRARAAAGQRPEISIHALLAESDISQLQCILGGKYFYPRSPCGERLQSECPFAEAVPDFYPRSPCGERLVNLGNIATTRTLFLSTLSLRRATARPRYYSMGRYISIHALLAESDHSFSHAIIILVLFLSTLSLRRATTGGQSCSSTLVHFYPRSPCGERLLPS